MLTSLRESFTVEGRVMKKKEKR
uniref:Uncharacterized protein n=1 Tax=Anguilla anguilla TaxID=7936 RepID=A0A0E9SAW2_ANGAN